jgi:dTDP-4-dehydrorhamnose reductase
MTLLVFGAGGQVGRALMEEAQGRAIGFDRAGCDISDEAAIRRAFASGAVSAVVNCAAYTAVDRAESEREQAFAINAQGAATIARVAAAHAIPVIHLSTDYVYAGALAGAVDEAAPIAPLNAYGASKAAGDAAVMAENPAHIVLRVSWVFGVHGANFVKTMLRLGRERSELRIVADQRGGPTEAGDIATAILTIAGALRAPGFDGWGIYHFAGAPATSWCDFAQEIFARAPAPRPKLTPIATSDYPTPARRPLNSTLDCGKILRRFAIRQPDWRVALSRVMTALERGTT